MGLGFIKDESGESGGVDADGLLGFRREIGERGEVEDLTLGEQACAELGVGEGLDRRASFVF